MQIEGAWKLGWALDVHTVSSVFLDYDQHGRAQFDTKRSDLGEWVYQLKYRGQSQAADLVAAVMAEFLRRKPLVLSAFDLIVPAPASMSRPIQPVTSIAAGLAERLDKAFEEDAIRKIKDTPTLKSLMEVEQRREALNDAFEGDRGIVAGRGVLLVDDLYRSGATANAVTLALIAAGAARVYFLAATRTRSNV